MIAASIKVNPNTGALISPTAADLVNANPALSTGNGVAHATATLSKIVDPVSAEPATLTVSIAALFAALSGGGSWSNDGDITITTSSGANTIAFSGTEAGGSYSGTSVNIALAYNDTVSYDQFSDSAADLGANLAGAINTISGLTASFDGSDVLTITTTATGAAQTIAISGASPYNVLNHDAVYGIDASEESGTRFSILAAAVDGKTNYILNAKGMIATGGVAWVSGNPALGYWDGATFTPAMDVGGAPGAGTIMMLGGGLGPMTADEAATYLTPPVGQALACASQVDETTGDPFTFAVEYATL